MPNPNYERGVRFEREVMTELEARGYAVIRASGSHGQFDVVGYRSDRPVELVQCKVLKKGSKTEADRMTRNFALNPPLEPSKYFHQVLEVKVLDDKLRVTAVV